MNNTKPGFKRLFRVLFILFIGGIGVHTFISCSSDDDAMEPSMPISVTATANSTNSITVNWEAVPDATGYYIYRNTSPTGTYDTIAVTSSTSYTDASLSSGRIYYYKIAAYNSGGIGATSSYASAATFLPTVSACDGMEGSTVTIGNQTWMKRNLNCDVGVNECYGNNPANCNTYGRLYSWATAMNLPGSCNSTSCPVQLPHKGICPTGWHLPSEWEWTALISYVGSNAGTKLKAETGWDSNIGTDDYGFSALPGGYSDGNFDRIGTHGYWWSASSDGDGNSTYAYGWRMNYHNSNVDKYNYGKNVLYSVRCLQD